MPWIESHTVLVRHRKLVELARSLRLSPAHCLGHLHVLWHAALEQREDGDLSDWSDEFIAEQAGFTGDAPQFVRLLELHGWLDGKLIHDWLDYAGRYLIGRYSSKNRERLVEIWKRHGRVYGEQKASERRVKGERNRSPPLVGQVNELKTENGSVSRDGAAVAPNETPAGVAWRFRSLLSRPPNSQETEEACEATFAELQADGVQMRDVLEYLNTRGKSVEKLWDVEKRFKPRKRARASTFTGLNEFMERGA